LAEEIIIPRVGETTSAVTILEWYKQEGDPVKKGEPLLEVETDKAALTIESFTDGILHQILKGVGQQAKGMEVVGIIRGQDENIDETNHPATENTRSTAENELEINSSQTQAAFPSYKDAARVPVSPLAKRIAKENGIDLDSVTGTGKDGMITADDVRNFVDKVASASGPSSRITPAKMRQAIGEQMVRSKKEIPHFYLSTQIDMEKVVDLRKSLLPVYQKQYNVHLTYTHILIRALALTLQDVPKANATYKDGNITIHQHINVGIAVSLDEGLIVPKFRFAEQKSLVEIAVEVDDLIKRARTQRLRMEEMTDGTFTISNLGKSEIDLFAAIINYPEAAILATGDILPKPIAIENRVAVHHMMGAVISADHRVLDGVDAAQFLRNFKHYLEDPYILL